MKHLPTPLPRPSPRAEDLATPGPSSATDSSFTDSSIANSSISDILTGTTDLGSHRTPALRNPCPNTRDRTMNPWLEGKIFSPMASSTSGSPPRPRSGSSQSLPNEDGEEIRLSPQRPRSASPRRGRVNPRRSDRIRETQLRMSDFFLPSPVKRKMERPYQKPSKRGRSPTKRGRSQGTSPDKRTSSLPPTPTASPLSKRRIVTTSDVDPMETSPTKSNETLPLQPDLNILTPMTSTSRQSSDNTSNEAGSKEMQKRSMSPPKEDSLPKPPSRFLAPRDSGPHSPSSMTAQDGSNEASVSESFEGSFSARVQLHSDTPFGGDPRHVMIKSKREGVEVEILTFEPFNLRRVIKQFFEEEYGFDNPGHYSAQDSDDSLIELDKTQTPEEIILLDNSMISPSSTAITTAEVQRFPAATLQVVRLEPSESLADMSNLAIEDDNMMAAIQEEEQRRPEERGEKDKRSR